MQSPRRRGEGSGACFYAGRSPRPLSKQQVSGHKGVDARQLKLKVSHGVAVHITFHDGGTSACAVAQLSGCAGEGTRSYHCEGLIASQGSVGINAGELDPVSAADKVSDDVTQTSPHP